MSAVDRAMSLVEEIDSDKGLVSKKRMLVITSLILSAIEILGIQITEVDAYFVKFKLIQGENISLFLVVCTVCLMVRYYSYANPYHEKLRNQLNKRILGEDFFFWRCEHSDEMTGLVNEAAPEGFDSPEIGYHNNGYRDFSYVSKFPLRREINYIWSIDGYNENSMTVSIFRNLGVAKYVKAIRLDLKHRVIGFFRHRENFYIWGPYFIGCVALASFFW